MPTVEKPVICASCAAVPKAPPEMLANCAAEMPRVALPPPFSVAPAVTVPVTVMVSPPPLVLTLVFAVALSTVTLSTPEPVVTVKGVVALPAAVANEPVKPPVLFSALTVVRVVTLVAVPTLTAPAPVAVIEVSEPPVSLSVESR